MPSLAGQELDKYAVLEEVGHGGMAVVYRGLDRVLDREVAVKVLHPHLADREESRQRLRREALTVAKLRHRNIVEIYDYSGPDAVESYIVTEFIHGQTLREWLDEKWQPHPVVAALLMHRLCLALEHAHAIGVVHRDIKPENVMIRRDGCLKLMDFGIAQILDQQKLTMTGQLLGSPAYMAPELICGKPVDKRTDLFACGVLLYQLSTGLLPFSGRNPHEVLHKISDAQYQAATEANAKVDSGLSDLIDHALAQEASDRFQSARSMANGLEDYLSGFDIDAEEVDLSTYFTNPQVFLDELDQRLSATLLQKARAETKNGNRAKALGLLGQVLELDPDSKDARALVEEVKAKGRRMRVVVFMASALAVGGLVTAGVMLSRATGPQAASLGEDRGEPVMRKRDANGSIIPTKARAQQGRPNTPSAEGGGVDAGVPTIGEGGSASGGDTPRKIRKARINPGFQVGPTKTSRTCAIQIDGLTQLQLNSRTYALETRNVDGSGKPARFPIRRDGSASVAVELGSIVSVKLVPKTMGTATKGGSGRITKEPCIKGEALKIKASALPTKVRFKHGSTGKVRSSLGKISIICHANCWDGASPGDKELADRTLRFSRDDSTEYVFRYKVKADGAKQGLTYGESITPGTPSVVIKLNLQKL